MEDVLATTRANLATAISPAPPACAGAGRAMAAFSPALLTRLKALKDFQMQNMYRHPRIAGSMTRAKAVVTDLYEAFVADPGAAAARLGRGGAARRCPARWRGTISPA